MNDLLQETSQLLSEMKNPRGFVREGRERWGYFFLLCRSICKRFIIPLLVKR
jgi:hypothetical protein